MIDVALTEDDERPGRVLAHRPDCPVVARHRKQDRMIMTMFGVELPIPEARLCSCLQEKPQ